MNRTNDNRQIAVIGAGPAGLMAAEVMAGRGLAVTVFDHMPSAGRKLLMAGRGGLNLTHSEPLEHFVTRYGAAQAWMTRLLAAFPPGAAMAWCEGLGQPTFVGSSGRVFPKAMKASPLLRAWLKRLAGLGVRLITHARWTGWTADGALAFADGRSFAADAVVLALGGASWPRLGSDGAWTTLLPDIAITPLRPANCGFTVPWSEPFRRRHAGQPLKNVELSFRGHTVRGEALIDGKGIEGGAVYALAQPIRETIEATGSAVLYIDLRPDVRHATLAGRLADPHGKATLATRLRKRAGLSPVAIGLVQEALHAGADIPLPALIKALPLKLQAAFPLVRAISTAGGIALGELDDHLMLRRRPGVFAAGEMLAWEAPTGGYLLQGCLASGFVAGHGLLDWLGEQA